ncbi:DUF4625 domain-containing protein [Labilibaculum sp.]|uniref:DUF4625 domain-containing protein n=1 Tax=Labilibaculum sp. TaxID=2060723 RepID=UPI00356786AB
MKFLKYTLIVLLALSLFSCKSSSGGDDDDETNPTISISSPISSTSVDAGDELLVQFTATDNVGLSSYVLTVDYSSSTSTTSVASVSTKTVEKFSFTSVTGKDADGNNLPSISGTSSTVSFDMAIDYDAEPGMYKMTVTITDSSDNDKSEDVTFEIE